MIFDIICISKKLKSTKPNKLELTVFIKVRMDSLIELSKFTPDIVNKNDNVLNDIKNIIIDKKYLSITS